MNHPQPRVDLAAAASRLAGALPTSNYASPEHFQDELEYVFRRAWINVCQERQLPRPGDFLVQEMHAIGPSVLIVRGSDGALRAFLNVCSHRGNRVEVEARGNKSGFTCLFHGWTYDRRGQLASVPQAEKFATVDPPSMGLRPVHLDTWGGMVFICLAPQPPCTLDEFLSPMRPALASHLAGQDWYPVWRIGIEARCNWKLPYDAFTEFYHFEALHPKSIAGGLAMKDSLPVIFERSPGVVGYFECYYNVDGAAGGGFLPPTRIQQLAAELGSAGLHTPGSDSAHQTRFPDALNGSGRPDWAVDCYGVLPHTTWQVLGQTFATQRVWPIAVDRCRVELDMWTLVPPPRTFAQMFNVSAVNSRTVDVLSEDLSTLERVQANLGPGNPQRAFHFNTDEALVKGLQDRIADWIARGKAA